MTTDFTRVAWIIAKKYIRKFPYLRDDIIGAANLGMVYGLTKPCIPRKAYYRAYIGTFIKAEVLKVIKQRILSSDFAIPSVRQGQGTDLLEALINLCRDTTDREIIKGRMLDETDEQIGNRLGYTQQAVSYRRKTLWQILIKEHPEYA